MKTKKLTIAVASVCLVYMMLSAASAGVRRVGLLPSLNMTQEDISKLAEQDLKDDIVLMSSSYDEHYSEERQVFLFYDFTTR